jgi:transposase
MEIAVLGIDLGKNSCSIVALDQAGAVVKRRRMRPESIPGLTGTMPPVSLRWKPAAVRTTSVGS